MWPVRKTTLYENGSFLERVIEMLIASNNLSFIHLKWIRALGPLFNSRQNLCHLFFIHRHFTLILSYTTCRHSC